MTLAYGTVQRRATLDHVIPGAGLPPQRLDPPVLAALRLGLLQLLFLDGIAEHAAVHESVELAKTGGGGGAGLVNAVLRRATREGRALLAGLETHPGRGGDLHSVPVWLAELWFARARARAGAGAAGARSTAGRIGAAGQHAAWPRSEARAPLPVAVAPAPGCPRALVLDGAFDVHGSELFAPAHHGPVARVDGCRPARWRPRRAPGCSTCASPPVQRRVISPL